MRSRYPASIRASLLRGGDLTSPLSQTSGSSVGFMGKEYVKTDILSSVNVHWFLSLDDARDKIELWRIDYNRFRPHSSLGDLTPEEFRDQHLEAGVF